MSQTPYNDAFYARRNELVLSSAEQIVPLVLELIKPRSVVDVGCGNGIWLAVFQKLGVHDVLGLDGEWVKPGCLQIPAEKFKPADLKKPIALGRTFDLVLSIEVAEHLPPECARTFVDSLTRLAPVVLFSAAIPYQGGVGHLNEQWVDYWTALFRERGFRAEDCLRPRIWKNEKIQPFYRQNAMVFLKDGHSVAGVRAPAVSTPELPFVCVHPQFFEAKVRELKLGNDDYSRRTFELIRIILARLWNRLRKFGTKR